MWTDKYCLSTFPPATYASSNRRNCTMTFFGLSQLLPVAEARLS
jgi:hypothetical protein